MSNSDDRVHFSLQTLCCFSGKVFKVAVEPNPSVTRACCGCSFAPFGNQMAKRCCPFHLPGVSLEALWLWGQSYNWDTNTWKQRWWSPAAVCMWQSGFLCVLGEVVTLRSGDNCAIPSEAVCNALPWASLSWVKKAHCSYLSCWGWVWVWGLSPCSCCYSLETFFLWGRGSTLAKVVQVCTGDSKTLWNERRCFVFIISIAFFVN